MIQKAVGGCAQYWADVIADKLIAEGVIVPPCKVGDTVYCIRYNLHRKANVKELEVMSVTYCKDGGWMIFTSKNDFWNKTAFATREEAEKHLQKGRSNET